MTKPEYPQGQHHGGAITVTCDDCGFECSHDCPADADDEHAAPEKDAKREMSLFERMAYLRRREKRAERSRPSANPVYGSGRGKAALARRRMQGARVD